MKRTVLLDVDGTLIDSNDLHAEAWRVTLEAFSIHVSFTRVRALIGMGGDKLLPALSGLRHDSPRGAELKQRRQQLFLDEYAEQARALPGARALIERLLATGHRPVVATSANAEEVERLLSQAGLSDLLPIRTTADDADRSKPDPDIIRAALALAGASPREALLIGDTPYDLKAAARAEVGFIGLRSGGYDDHALRGALAVYADARELCSRFDDSPLRAN